MAKTKNGPGLLMPTSVVGVPKIRWVPPETDWSSGARDIRLSRVFPLRKFHLMNMGRVLLLILSDLLFLKVAAATAAWGQMQGLLPSLAFQEDPRLLAFYSIAMVAIVGGYNAGKGRRGYLTLAGTILMSSFFGIIPQLSSLAPSGRLELLGYWLPILMVWFSRAALVALGRYAVEILVTGARYRGVGCYKVFVIAEEKNQETASALIQRQQRYKIVAIEDSSVLDRNRRAVVFSQISDMRIDEVFVDWLSLSRRPFLLQSLKATGAVIRLLPLDSNLATMEQLELLDFDNLTAFTLPTESPLVPWFLIKRVIDSTASGIALLLLSPFLLLISLCIKLDSAGPIFYQQTRVGLKGKEFQVWKFRSMVVNADALQAELEQHNETDGVLFKIKRDPRITKLGAFMRRYSIDELPQLFNVFLGQMSLVGPRPLPVRDVQRFPKKRFFIRHEVLPGITGLWQVSGRSDIQDFDEAYRLDMKYIEDWSLALDFRILLKTIHVVLFNRGAY